MPDSGELSDLRGDIKELAKEIRDLAQKQSDFRIEVIGRQAALEIKIVESKAATSEKISGIDAKTAVMWALIIAIFAALGTFLATRIFK